MITQLMLAGYTLSQIANHCEDKYGWSFAQAKNTWALVSEDWTKQSEEELQHARAQAIQRIRADLVRMRISQQPTKAGRKGKKEPTIEPATFKDIAAHEMLLARIEGTLRPVEVKVDIRASSRRALIDTINAMAPEDMDQLVIEQRELETKLLGR